MIDNSIDPRVSPRLVPDLLVDFSRSLARHESTISITLHGRTKRCQYASLTQTMSALGIQITRPQRRVSTVRWSVG